MAAMPSSEATTGAMVGTWRISTYNAVLVSMYLVPAWIMAGLKIIEAPISGVYDRANIAFGIFATDYLYLGALGTARVAWVLAVARFTVAAFFILFVIQIARPRARLNGDGDEALGIALALGGIVSFMGMVLAAQVGEQAALRLHATETLLLLAAGILALVEPLFAKARTNAGVKAQQAAALPAAASDARAEPAGVPVRA